MRAERRSHGTRSWLLAVSALLVGCGGVAGQERAVVSKEISVGSNEASLRLEFPSGDPLEVALRDGRFWVGDEDVGPSSPELETAWRSLLGQAVALEDGPLADALMEWSPPGQLSDDVQESGARVNQALDEAFSVSSSATPDQEPGTVVRERALVAALLGRRERLMELAEALDDVRISDIQLHVGEEVTVPEDTRVDGTVVMVDGNLEVAGEVDGDVVVVGGSVRLQSGGTITGNVHLADSRIYRDGGEVEGDVVEVDLDSRGSLNESLRDEIRRELENAARDRGRDRDSAGFFAPLRYVGRGIAGVISTLLTVMVLGLIGGAVLHFAGNNLEIVAETARRAPARSAAVGLAGTFLAVPVWVLGTVALAISIVGIPAILLWLPLFPLVVVLGVGLGYYAVAQNVGSWIAHRHYPSLGWIRLSNPYTLVAGGLLGLMAAFLAANALEIGGPWLSFLQGICITLGVLATVAAVLVGFGAVLITRAGRRPEYYPASVFDDEWGDTTTSTPGAGDRGSWTPPPSPTPEASTPPEKESAGGSSSEVDVEPPAAEEEAP